MTEGGREVYFPLIAPTPNKRPSFSLNLFAQRKLKRETVTERDREKRKKVNSKKASQSKRN